jgi:lysozyme family protein
MPGRTVDTLTEDEAKDIYYKAFWMEYHLDALGSIHPSLAFKVFDFCVTAGPDPAFRCLQRAMRANLVETKEDGVMGPITRGQLKSFLDGNESCGQACMLVAYRSECAGYYRDLDKPRFESGWIARAYR